MRFVLINSGLGLLAAAFELHKLRPDADLVIAMDPDGMPWGPRAPEDIAERSLAIARAAARYQPDVIVMACNTGSVHALEVLRSHFEPRIPVVGTVPAIKPAAAAARSIAIWATVATTESAYQRKLIDEFGSGAEVTPVACPGLATAIDAGNSEAIEAAIADAAARTPARCSALVLGCTEYELAADQIGAAIPGATLFGSAAAVATQALRRATLAAADHAQAINGTPSSAAATPIPSAANPSAANPSAANPSAAIPSAAKATVGTLTVLLSGRPASLPPAALRYRQGRELAQLDASRDPATGLAV